ncbi:MAG: hypothetical protein RSC49_01865 [Clostridium sp.]
MEFYNAVKERFCCANKTLENFILSKEVYFYGTSIAGIEYLMNLRRLCYLGK